MPEEKQKLNVTATEIRIGIGIIICLFAAHYIDLIQALASCTAVIMCTQDTSKFTMKSSLIRLLGVVIGGACGALVVGINTLVPNDYLFYVLCGAGVVLNLFCCKVAKMQSIVARVSCITFILVTILLPGTARFEYALLRLLGTLFGAVVAFVIAWIWDKVAPKSRAGAASK